MTELLPNIFAIEVPKSRLFHFQIDCNNEDPEDLFCTVSMIAKGNGPHRFVELPYGSYGIMFTTKGVSEENAMLIATVREANGYPIGYKDYENDDESYREATDSLHSLLRSKGLTAGNYLIIKKVEG